MLEGGAGRCLRRWENRVKIQIHVCFLDVAVWSDCCASFDVVESCFDRFASGLTCVEEDHRSKLVRDWDANFSASRQRFPTITRQNENVGSRVLFAISVLRWYEVVVKRLLRAAASKRCNGELSKPTWLLMPVSRCGESDTPAGRRLLMPITKTPLLRMKGSLLPISVCGQVWPPPAAHPGFTTSALHELSISFFQVPSTVHEGLIVKPFA